MKEKFGPSEENIEINPPFKPLAEVEGFKSNIKSVEDNPDKLVRSRNLGEHLEKKFELGFSEEEFKRGKVMFDKMRNEYGISIPDIQLIIGEEKGQRKMFTVIDRIYGKSLDKIEIFPPEAQTEADDFFYKLANFFYDIFKRGGDYWSDLRNDQYVYGHKKNEKNEKIYIVDTDPVIEHYDPDSKGENYILPDVYDFENRDNSRNYRLFDVIELLFSDMLETEQKFNPPIELTKTRKFLGNMINEIPKNIPGRSTLDGIWWKLIEKRIVR